MGKVMRYQVADYLDVGAASADFALMGAGFNSLNEATGAKSETTTYISDKASSTYIKGYETEFSFDTDLIVDEEAISFIYDVARNQRTGSDAETDYVRVELFSPVAGSDNTYKARKFCVCVEVAQINGEGAGALKITGSLKGRGDFTDGSFNTQTRTFTAC